MKIQTINQLISVWKDIATRHYQINYFGVGDSWEVGVDNASMHPVLWVNPTTANMPSSDNGYKTFEIDFEVRCFDLVNKDESNENEVLSDTIDILKDIIAEFKGHPYYVNSQLNIIDDISFEAFTEEFDEEVSGWLCEISLMTPVLTTFCGIPSADITGYEFPGIDCPDSNVLCPVFVDDVTGVYPIVVNTNGTSKEVTLDLNGVPDTYVESGVYSAGTLTLTRNDAVEIEVTGFTDENDFTTGVTLDGNILNFDRTDLVDAYSVDLTALLTPYLTGQTFNVANDNTLTSTLSDATTIDTVIDNFDSLTVVGTVDATAFTGDGSGLTGITGANIATSDLTQSDQYRRYTFKAVNPSKLYFSGANGNMVYEDSMNMTFWSGTEGASVSKFAFYHTGGQSILDLQDGKSQIKGNGGNIRMTSNLTTVGSGIIWDLDGSYATLLGSSSNSVFDTGINNVLFADYTRTTLYGKMTNGRFVWGSHTFVGSSGIELQRDTLVKGTDTSSGTNGFEVTDSTNASLLKVKNNGVINASALPTSATGLSAGDIWNNAGVLNIV